MGKPTDHLDLIRQARLGDKESMSALALLASRRVLVYIYRLTLDYDLSQDLTQETMLDMVKSIKKLNDPEKFWPWLFRTALGKVQHQFRNQGPTRIANQTLVNTTKVLQHAPEDVQTGLTSLVQKESKCIVVEAMGRIKLSHRNILSLRCFEQMSYSEIASMHGCTELQARLLFFRAKRSLKKQLSRQGLGKEHFLSAMGLFGAITAVADKSATAAASVSAVSTQVGLAASIIGNVTTGIGAAVIISLAAAVIVVTNIGGLENRGPGSPVAYIGRIDVEELESFAYPSSIIAEDNPDDDGWQGSSYTLQAVEPQLVYPPELLVGPHPESTMTVLFPDNHWMKFGYAGVITDGPGIDIYLDGRINSGRPLIFVTNAAGQEYELDGPWDLRNFGNGYALIGCDISELPDGFEPRGVRILGTGRPENQFGYQLYFVRARITR